MQINYILEVIMKGKRFFLVVSAAIFLTGCVVAENPCEDITQVSEQIQACEVLQRQINNAKDRPLVRTELERRYQQDCIDIRFYRDDKQKAICGNKPEIEKIREENKAAKN